MFKLIKDIWDELPFEARAIGAAIIGVVILLIIVFARIGACRDRHEDQKIANQQANITVDKVESNVLANEKTEIQGEVNNAANNANAAAGNFANSVNRDSGSFTGDGTDRFCRRFPNDSTCADWRRRHGLQ